MYGILYWDIRWFITWFCKKKFKSQLQPRITFCTHLGAFDCFLLENSIHICSLFLMVQTGAMLIAQWCQPHILISEENINKCLDHMRICVEQRLRVTREEAMEDHLQPGIEVIVMPCGAFTTEIAVALSVCSFCPVDSICHVWKLYDIRIYILVIRAIFRHHFCNYNLFVIPSTLLLLNRLHDFYSQIVWFTGRYCFFIYRWKQHEKQFIQRAEPSRNLGSPESCYVCTAANTWKQCWIL